EARLEVDAAGGILGNSYAVVNRVRRSWWNQAHIGQGACGPGITLVDGIAVAIELQRAIEVSAFFDGPLSTVFDHAAPENNVAILIGSLKLEPHIERVHRTAREEVSDLARAYDDIHAIRLS